MELPDAIEAIRPAVVQICLQQRGKLPRILGTGFVVDERATVVTALHVLRAGRDAAKADGIPLEYVAGLAHPYLHEAGGETFRLNGFSLVRADPLVVVPDHDLAALRLQKNPFDPDQIQTVELGGGVETKPLIGAAMLHEGWPRDGAAVAVSGFPFAINSLITSAGHVASAWYVDEEDVPIPPMPDDHEGGRYMMEIPIDDPEKERFLVDIEANVGNSGGPVYLHESGEVIGVCVSSKPARVTDTVTGRPAALTHNSGLTVVVPTKYVREMLRDGRVAS